MMRLIALPIVSDIMTTTLLTLITISVIYYVYQSRKPKESDY